MSDTSRAEKSADPSESRDPRSLVFAVVFLSRPRLDFLTGLSAFMTILLVILYAVAQAYSIFFIWVGMRLLFELGVFLTPDIPAKGSADPSVSATPDTAGNEPVTSARPAPVPTAAPGRTKGGNLFVFLAAAGVIVSFFVPVFSSDMISFSMADILSELMRAEILVPTFGGFIFFSGLAAVSTFLGYLTRNHPLSILGAYGIYFYARIVLDLFYGTGATGNIFSALKSISGTGLFSGNDLPAFASHSPAVILYILSTLCLMVACVGIVKGYADMARRFSARF